MVCALKTLYGARRNPLTVYHQRFNNCTGILFTHWIADSLTLWKVPITSEHIWTAASYYALFARSPPQLGYALASVVTLGAATILWSLGDGAAGNLMFDGASICTSFFYKSVPTWVLRTIIPDSSIWHGYCRVLVQNCSVYVDHHYQACTCY